MGRQTFLLSTDKGRQVTGKYVAKAEFETGPATINIKAIKKGDNWQLMGFQINSMTFIQRKML